MLVIPAIDIIDEKIVRLTEGDYTSSKVYTGSPVKQAEYYSRLGFSRIHIIDLIGSKDGRITTAEIIKAILYSTDLEIEFGGGVRSEKDVELLIQLGIQKIIVGSLPLSNWELFKRIVDKYSPERFVIAADSLNNRIRYKGWTEDSGMDLFEFIRKCSELGLEEFLCTDISKDGKNEGPSFLLYTDLVNEFPDKKIIASGGIRGIEDIQKLENYGLFGAVVGKAIYEGKLTEEELKKIAG